MVNADSMQVYRDLWILTARPSTTEVERRPHALYGHVDAANAYSVAAWLDDARTALEAARSAGCTAIFVGGTGLYLAALTQGLSPVPPIPARIRAHWRGRQADGEALHGTLAALDPLMAERLRPSDTQRIVRALEVFDATGRSLAHWQAVRCDGPLTGDLSYKAIVLEPPRDALRGAIATRFSRMLEEGALEEVERLVARDLPPDRPAMKAIGVRPLAAHLAGEVTLNEATEQAVRDSGRYAKRQSTWFRHRFSSWERAGEANAAYDLILAGTRR